MDRSLDTPKRAYREERYEDARLMLLEDAEKKPVRYLSQIDAHVTEGDSVMYPDEDGHCLMSGETYELRRSPAGMVPVRVHIDPDADKEDVLSMLAKVYSWLARDWSFAAGQESPPDLEEVGRG